MNELRERIRRALLLVPLVAGRKEGIPVEELAQRLGVPPESLSEEIDFLMLVGRPPFSPADFLDLYLEGGRVHADLSLRLERPPRLTHDEALALAVGGQTIMQRAGPAFAAEVSEAIQKIEAAMSESELARYHAERARTLGGSDGASLDDVAGEASDTKSAPGVDVHAVLRAAVDARQALLIDSYSAYRDARSERIVYPYALVFSEGYWYLAAGDESTQRSEDPGDTYKLFRIDRIHAARPEGEPGTVLVPASVDLESLRGDRFLRRAGEAVARVRVDAKKARFAAETMAAEDCQWQEDGSVEIVFPLPAWEWVSAWVLSLTPHAQVLAPAELLEKVRADARKALDTY